MAPDSENFTKEVFEKISKDDVSGVQLLLSECKSAEIFDEHGMTPLQHAAYRGNKDMVKLLLDQGADVNSGKHEHSYTALHFAALSGNAEVCQLLLLSGAKPTALNSVSRTAAQMAAFVRNHACVATINNFVPRTDIEHFAKPQGPQSEPYIKPHLIDPIHKFIMQINLNPVRIVLNLQRSGIPSEYWKNVKQVLELLCEKEMKGSEINEIMGFKFHYLSYVVGEVVKSIDRQLTDDKKSVDVTELFIRKLLKTNKEGNCDYMDGFIKESVREFPNRKCTIFRQIVASLAGPDPPSAISVVTAAVNGQRAFQDSFATCYTCGEEKPGKKCSKCKAVQYCDRECQRLHWFLHKKVCARMASEPILTTNPVSGSEDIDAAALSSQIQNLLTTN